MSGDPGVLLDVDGTLVDTNHLHVLAWSRAFRRAGRPIPMHRIHERIGMGGDRLVADLLGEDAPQAEAVTDAWAEEFHHLWPEVRLLPGAKQLVRSLHLRRQRVVLASSAPAGGVDRFRQLLDVDDWLTGATSSDDAEGSKPDPDIFEVAIDRFGLDPAQTVAVGDSVWDARAAERAGIGFIGVETGGTDRRVLGEEGAIRVVRDAAALTQLIDKAGVEALRPG
jgi:HAD superfamily hydrolase (TIGR01509 family)